MYKIVIFDLDGTLLNTLEDIADCTNMALKNNNYPVSDLKEYNYFVGKGIGDMVRSALPQKVRNDENLVSQITQEFSEEYKTKWNNKTYIYEGILELFSWIKNNKIKIGILSNKPHNFTVEMVDYYFADIEIDIAWGKKDQYDLKPSPKSAKAIIDEIGVKKDEVLYVGDTSVDMLTAKNAGFTSVGVSWGFRKIDELVDNGANFIVYHPTEIIDILNADIKLP